MSKRKQILLILAAMAVLLTALGILLGMVLNSDQQKSQPVAEDTVSDGKTDSSNVSRVSKFPPVTYVSRPENHAPQLPPDPPMPDNFELDCPPPSVDQLYPDATEEVDYLTYAKQTLSLNDSEYIGYGNPIYASFTLSYEDMENLKVDYYETELVSIQEALEADNLILWWQYDMGMRGGLQPPFFEPVQYYRVKDYEPVTVMAICVKSDVIPRWFAIRDRVIQAVVL